LTRCLRSVERQSGPFVHVTVVVDSGSDPAVAAAASAFPGVRVVRPAVGTLGPGEARNAGAKDSHTDYLAFIDADCVAEDRWLASAIDALSPGPQMTGGPILDGLPWHPVAVADNLLQLVDVGPWRPTGPALRLPSGNMAVRRAAFVAVGGFPDVDGRAGSDTGLCALFREQCPGGIQFDRRMRVKHDGRASMPAFLRHQSDFGYARAVHALTITPEQRRWGARWYVMPLVMLKRLSHIVRRTLQWYPARTLHLVVLMPLLVMGLAVWAVAFRRGCLRAVERPQQRR
jgi:glycosyltransferase involved in cell wall biosynthesis